MRLLRLRDYLITSVALLALTFSSRLLSQQQPRPIFTDRVDTVQGFVRVYQARAARLLATTLTRPIVDGPDRIAFDLSRQIGSDQFTGDRNFDYLFEVPVGRLKPGPHLLRVDAVAGKATARRDIRFAIR